MKRIHLFNLYTHLVDIIYPKLLSFRNADLISYPVIFSEFSKNEYKSLEEYNKLKDEGKIIGGGFEKWLETLDEIIFAFEFIKAEENPKFKKKVFLKKYEDWEKETPENKKDITFYKNKIDEKVLVTTENEEVSPEFEKTRESFYYWNDKLYKEYSRKAEKGFELFGKFFMSLWI